MRRSSLFWGMILVVFGGILLLDKLNILSIHIWNLIWPLFLIAAGVWVVIGVSGGKRAYEVESVAIPMEGATQADVTIHHGAGRLVINNQVTTGNFISGAFGGGLSVTRRLNGRGMSLELRPKVDRQTFWDFPWMWGGHSGYDWEMAVSPEVPLTLRLETGADDARIDMTDLRVTDLRLHTGASSSDLKLPAHMPTTHIRVEGGAASIKLHVPGGVAAQISAQSGVSSISIDETRFPWIGNLYQSPAYATAPNKVDIDIQMGAGSVRVD
jgi:Domain of unknown function (DUF5668)/Cell wall-active antibiotics response 4TMS YvqF